MVLARQCNKRKDYFATVTAPLNIEELLKLALAKFGTYAAICTETGLNKSTLWRQRTRKSGRAHDRTVGKLFNAINKGNPNG